jgi:hypothetical protein
VLQPICIRVRACRGQHSFALHACPLACDKSRMQHRCAWYRTRLRSRSDVPQHCKEFVSVKISSAGSCLEHDVNVEFACMLTCS